MTDNTPTSMSIATDRLEKDPLRPLIVALLCFVYSLFAWFEQHVLQPSLVCTLFLLLSASTDQHCTRFSGVNGVTINLNIDLTQVYWMQSVTLTGKRVPKSLTCKTRHTTYQQMID